MSQTSLKFPSTPKSPDPDFVIFTDGGARGNPGPAAIGFVIKDSSGNLIHQQGSIIEPTTNNVAEYQAVIHALNWLLHHPQKPSPRHLLFYLDSKLVVNQLSGNFKIKKPHLQKLFNQIKFLESDLNTNCKYSHIPRAQNHQADHLLNLALDRLQS